MVVDGHHEQVKNALMESLRLIDASKSPSTYHHGPGTVFATPYYKKQYWAATEKTLWHGVRAGIAPVSFVMGCDYEHTAEFFVIACIRAGIADRVLEWSAKPEQLQYTTLQNRLLDDLEQALLDGDARDGHPLNGFATDGEALVDSLDFTEINRRFYAQGWCCLEVRLELLYHTPKRR